MMCKLVLKAAMSHDDHLRGTRYGRGFWTLREHRNCITAIGETPRQVTFLTNFGAERPAADPVFSDCPDDGDRLIVLSSPGQGMAENRFADGFLRAIGTGVAMFAPTGVVDRLGCHVEGSKPYDRDVVNPEKCRKDMKVWVYGNWWASGRLGDGGTVRADTLMGIGARVGTEPHILKETFNSKEHQVFLCGSGIGLTVDDGIRHPPARTVRPLTDSSAIIPTHLESTTFSQLRL